MFGSGREPGQILEMVARPGVKLLLQVVKAAESTERLGRERHARGGADGTMSRNAYSEVTVKTNAGPMASWRGRDRA